MIEETCDVEFDETNGSQGEGFSCDDVGDEPLRDVMKKMAIGYIKLKEEDGDVPTTSTQGNPPSTDDDKNNTPQNDSSDEEDEPRHAPSTPSMPQVDQEEEHLSSYDTIITQEQAQA